MKRQSTILTLALVLLFAGTLGFTQDAVSEKVTVPFSSPGKPGKIEVSNQRGSITIKGYSGQEVMVVATVREKKVGEEDEVHVELGEALRERVVERAKKVAGQDQKTAGLKKIPLPGSTGLTIEEENNTMEIRTSVMRQAVDLEIQVPSTTSLELSSLMGGSITVEGVNGDIDVNNMNGRIKLAAVSGTVLAHSMSGGIEVVFKEVTQGKPMSFSTMSGDIDVTLPASTKANLKMKTDYGEIFSDFEIKIDPTPQKVSEEPQREGGRYRISFDKYYLGSINGGGPEYLFKTFQGDILIRKAK
jgi:hypothetical protein